jgi:hypothetical protein
MQMALEALEEATTYTASTVWSPSMTKECEKAATALRSALAQPQDHIRDATKKVQGKWVGLTHDEIMEMTCHESLIKYFEAKLKEKNTPQVVPQGEPVGYWNGKETAWFEHELCGHPAPDDCTIPLYTTPPEAVEAAIEATKEKAIVELHRNAHLTLEEIAAAIRSMK